MTPLLRKALVGIGLTAATLTGGALGASFVGTASAQTTTTAPSDSTADKQADKEDCPLDGARPGDAPAAANTSAS